jgi:hypothetical protein
MLDGGDVMGLMDPADAARQFEPFIQDQPVEFFDALARPLRLVVRGGVRRRWLVDIDDREIVGFELLDEQPDEQRLRQALSAYLEHAGLEPPVDMEIAEFAGAAARLIQ